MLQVFTEILIVNVIKQSWNVCSVQKLLMNTILFNLTLCLYCGFSSIC